MKHLTAVLMLLALPYAAPAGAAQPALVLADRGKSDYVLVLPADAIPAEKYAAEELAGFLEQMTGARLPIVKEDARPSPHEILLGPTNQRLALLSAAVPACKEDGFCLKTLGSRLVISGDRPRGTLYAVYEFLERLGVRFFAPDVTRVPKVPRLAVPALDEVHAPAFRGRGHMLYAVQQSDNAWAVRLRYNSPWWGQWKEERGGHIRYGFGPHSFHWILPPEKYFKEHPDWYSEINGQRTPGGQLCLTNPQALEEVVRVVLERMRRMPDVHFWDVSQMDNLSYCRCAKCAALAEAEGAQSGPIVHFVNAVAERVEKEFPKNIISTFAYAYGVGPPRTVKARRNVAVRICTGGKDCLRPLDAASPLKANRELAEQFAGWARHAENLLVWDYGTNFADYLDIFPDPFVWKANLQFYRAHRVQVVDMQGAYSAPWGELCYLRAYVLGKLLWNPDQDDRALIREYLEGVYGAHAGLVGRFIEACAATALAAHPDKMMGVFGWEFNKAGFRYDDLAGWRDRLETALAGEAAPVRRRHLKLLLLPIYQGLVGLGQPRLVPAPNGLKPDRPVTDDYRRTVDRLFALGREFKIAAYREGAGDFETLEREVRGSLQEQPYYYLKSDTLSVRLLPGAGALITEVRAPAGSGETRLRAYETYVGAKWHDPGWCEFYRIEESTPTRGRFVAQLSGQMELERTLDLAGPTLLRISEKLTNRGPEQIRKPLFTNHIFPMAGGRDGEEIFVRQTDGTWQPGRYPQGVYEQMQPFGYAAGGGWALINKKTGKGVVVRFEPKDVSVIGFWVDNSFSFQTTTPEYRLDKDQSATRVHTIEWIGLERAAEIRGGR